MLNDSQVVKDIDIVRGCPGASSEFFGEKFASPAPAIPAVPAGGDYWSDRRVLSRAAQDGGLEFWGRREWRSMMTLTFEKETGYDVAVDRFRKLIKYMNIELFGKSYGHKIGHSYFSYLMGVEYQSRGVIHFHALVDRPINYVLVHSMWKGRMRCGYAWIESVRDRQHSLAYVTKYILKDGDIQTYVSNTRKVPSPLPLWFVLPG